MGIGDGVNLGVPDAAQKVQNSSSAIAGVSTGANTGLVDNTTEYTPLPWEKSGISSKFFQSIKIDPRLWDQFCPYRLLVIDSKNNQIVSGSEGQPIDVSITVLGATGSPLITWLTAESNWVFQLPITPQQLTITDQYSIQTSATLRGILEEHSGVRFKMINAQGTMGVWPYRASITAGSPGSPGFLQSIFGGTIGAAGNLASHFSNVVRTLSSEHPASKPTTIRPPDSDNGETSTGYYQAMKLQQFLEQYVEAKKNPANASWRLVFNITKQSTAYVVTPMQYEWGQSVSPNPMSISYKLQLKAWRRIDLYAPPQEAQDDSQPLSPGILQRILNTFTEAQQVLSSALNLIAAVRSDVDKPLDALRQARLFVKGLAGVLSSVADLPSQIQSDYRSAISSSIVSQSGSIMSNLSDPKTIASVKSTVSQSNQSEGLTQSAVSSGQLGSTAAIYQSLNPVQNIFATPQANFLLFDQLPVSSLVISNTQNAAIQNVINEANQTTIAQLKEFRATMLQLALQLSNSFGTGSAYYNEIFGLPAPQVSYVPITIDQYGILAAIYESLTSFDILTASTQIDDKAIETSMEYVAGLADSYDINFTIPNSKVLVPVPYGLSIEKIAARYLGDPELWIEIATLNGLTEPYIDESGFQLPILSNAIARQVVVSSDSDLFIGQTVTLVGAGQKPSSRIILGIEKLSITNFLLTLDGLPNLDNFTTAIGSYVQAYLPGTVNSQQKIYIPSALSVPDLANIIPPPSTSGDPLTGLSKVDWLLTDGGDLALNNYGDFRYSSGITNIIQALRIKFGTQVNTVLTHPNFGLSARVGSISSQVQLQQIYDSINQMISQDPRFQGVSNLQITLNGPVLGISVGVQLPGTTGVFPISFALTTPT